ncbi:YcgL domain-containing protein [Halomonas halmophila]|uniref:YcgL domain-containing protein HHA01_07590 n=1 Tax=Halomonas halmophila TaxID=252 RepID=A0A4Y4EV68_9GAMM|nr:YcgL domain-containing protein [Halomonas halmophila]GED21782.1 YcgL domain-containing protein [Halomonas halmophila]
MSYLSGKLLCDVFKSPLKEGMYLFVDKRQGLDEVPEALLERFGEPVSAMTLLLTPEKSLARTTGAAIMAAIEEKGYYLQMPPAKEEYLLDLYRTPTEGRY